MSTKAASLILALIVALVSFSAAEIPVMEDPMILMNSTLDASVAAGNQRYFIYNDLQLTFFEAWHQCRSHGLRLATVKSTVDDAQLKLAFAENGFNGEARWWIAGTELGKTGSYVWISDNKLIEYKNFLPNEPNNIGGVEHCLEVGSGGIGSTQWNDYNCDSKLRYICELDTCAC